MVYYRLLLVTLRRRFLPNGVSDVLLTVLCHSPWRVRTLNKGNITTTAYAIHRYLVVDMSE